MRLVVPQELERATPPCPERTGVNVETTRGLNRFPALSMPTRRTSAVSTDTVADTSRCDRLRFEPERETLDVPSQEPMLNTVAITDLRPTQITVGFREVAEKRRGWGQIPDDRRPAFLARHVIPVLLGPKTRS